MNFLKALQGKSKVWFLLAVVFLVAASGGIFAVIQKVQATDNYYILNQDVSAMQEITTDMLSEKVVSQGGAPTSALDLGDVQLGGVYATYQLKRGDILTESNTGPMQEITEGIPDEFVVASFEVPAKDAVAGYIQRGDYVDVIAVGETNTVSGAAGSVSKYVIRNAIVVAVDALGNSSVAASINDTENGAVAGQQRVFGTVYTVALPPLDAAKLALVKDLDLLVVLSPRTYLQDGVTPSYIGTTPDSVFGANNVGSSGYCTDPFFGTITQEDVLAAEKANSELPLKPECSIPGDIFGKEYDENGAIIGDIGGNSGTEVPLDGETNPSAEPTPSPEPTTAP